MYNSTRYASQETTGVFFFLGGGRGCALFFNTGVLGVIADPQVNQPTERTLTTPDGHVVIGLV